MIKDLRSLYPSAECMALAFCGGSLRYTVYYRRPPCDELLCLHGYNEDDKNLQCTYLQRTPLLEIASDYHLAQMLQRKFNSDRNDIQDDLASLNT